MTGNSRIKFLEGKDWMGRFREKRKLMGNRAWDMGVMFWISGQEEIC